MFKDRYVNINKFMCVFRHIPVLVFSMTNDKNGREAREELERNPAGCASEGIDREKSNIKYCKRMFGSAKYEFVSKFS